MRSDPIDYSQAASVMREWQPGGKKKVLPSAVLHGPVINEAIFKPNGGAKEFSACFVETVGEKKIVKSV
jgi:hypothetical protein